MPVFFNTPVRRFLFYLSHALSGRYIPWSTNNVRKIGNTGLDTFSSGFLIDISVRDPVSELQFRTQPPIHRHNYETGNLGLGFLGRVLVYEYFH